MYENVPSESYAVTEKYEGDSLEGQAADEGDAGLLEAVWSGGEGDEATNGEGGWGTAESEKIYYSPFLISDNLRCFINKNQSRPLVKILFLAVILRLIPLTENKLFYF